MGNTKYPSGIKVKAPLAWVGGAAIGFTPLFFFYIHALIKEHYTGNAPRKTYGEDHYFHAWLVTSYRHSLQGGEALRSHPQKVYSKFDRQRLRITYLDKL